MDTSTQISTVPSRDKEGGAVTEDAFFTLIVLSFWVRERKESRKHNNNNKNYAY